MSLTVTPRSAVLVATTVVSTRAIVARVPFVHVTRRMRPVSNLSPTFGDRIVIVLPASVACHAFPVKHPPNVVQPTRPLSFQR